MSTYHSRPPAPVHPALDFLRKVEVWQEDEANRTAGLIVVMPESEQSELTVILASANRHGDQLTIEDRARRWLIGYRELEDQQRVLTEAQRAELNAVVSQLRDSPYRQQQPRPKPSLQRLALVMGVLLIVIAAGLGISTLLTSSGNGSPPPAGPVAAAPAGPQPGALTDLQQFRADWNVPGSANADAGNPAALVLLQDGLYYPVLWSIPAGDPGWVTDSTGSVTASVTASVRGGDATVTDSGGTTYTVTVGQPFVLASNPQVIFRVLRDGTIQSMPEPHAIRIRVRT